MSIYAFLTASIYKKGVLCQTQLLANHISDIYFLNKM